MGFRRKRNDALLMFCLRHYGKDSQGKRTTINYFSSRASAGAGSGSGAEGAAAAEASTTTVRTVISGDGGPGAHSDAAARLEDFAGVALDAEAEAAIAAALRECAARAQAAEAGVAAGGEEAADWLADDPAEPFVPLEAGASPWRGELLPPVGLEDAAEHPGEDAWDQLGQEGIEWVAASGSGSGA